MIRAFGIFRSETGGSSRSSAGVRSGSGRVGNTGFIGRVPELPGRRGEGGGDAMRGAVAGLSIRLIRIPARATSLGEAAVHHGAAPCDPDRGTGLPSATCSRVGFELPVGSGY
jgi:hypothetical protein